MSMDYDIKAITNQPLTEEIIRQIVSNAKAIGFSEVEFSPDLDTRYNVELNEALAHTMWLEYQEESGTGLSWHFPDYQRNEGADFGIGLYKIDSNFAAVELFQLGGRAHIGRGSGLGIDFHWYVKKLLQISNPLPIIRLRTEVNFEGLFENQQVDFWIVKNSATCLNDYWDESKELILTNGIPDYYRTFFTKLGSNAVSHGYELSIQELTDEFLSQEKIIEGVARWGKFSLNISKSRGISVVVDNPSKYENLRKPLQLLIDLTEDMDATNFYADNGKNPNLPR